MRKNLPINEYRKEQASRKSSRMADHEHNRWETMSIKQLKVRIRKMTKLDKIKLFVVEAQARSEAGLAQMGIAQRIWVNKNNMG